MNTLKKMRRILAAAALCAGLALCLAACGTAFPGFPEHGYQNPPFSEEDWRDIDYGDNMTVDGSLDEAVWDTLSQASVSGDGVTMTLKTYLGETGMFFAMQSDEPWVFYNPNRATYNNTGAELYIAQGDGNGLDKNTVQVRIGADGYVETYIGLHDPHSEYTWTRAYVPCMAAVNVLGVPLNSGESDGYIMELYLPYQTIGLSSKPAKILALAAFNRIGNAEDYGARLSWHCMNGDFNRPSTYCVATVEGMNTRMSSGFTKNEDGTYSQNKFADQYCVFNSPEQSGTQYYFETEMTINRVLNGDRIPHAGIMAARTADGSQIVNLLNDSLDNFSQKDFLEVEWVGTDGETWAWAGSAYPNTVRKPGTAIDYAKSKTIKLAVYRSGVNFYYFINDAYFCMRDNYIGITAETPTDFGFYTMNMDVTYRNSRAFYGDAAAAAVTENTSPLGANFYDRTSVANGFTQNESGEFVKTSAGYDEMFLFDGLQPIGGKKYMASGHIDFFSIADWAQAVIMVRNDNNTKARFVVERNDQGKYIVWTDGIAGWQLLLGEFSGSGDFKVIVDHGNVYFFMDNELLKTYTGVFGGKDTQIGFGGEKGTVKLSNLVGSIDGEEVDAEIESIGRLNRNIYDNSGSPNAFAAQEDGSYVKEGANFDEAFYYENGKPIAGGKYMLSGHIDLFSTTDWAQAVIMVRSDNNTKARFVVERNDQGKYIVWTDGIAGWQLLLGEFSGSGDFKVIVDHGNVYFFMDNELLKTYTGVFGGKDTQIGFGGEKGKITLASLVGTTDSAAVDRAIEAITVVE